MTGIVLPPRLSPPSMAPTMSASSMPPSSGQSFAETLLALLDRALVSASETPDDRFAAGTMRPSVEQFDARGFFEDRALADRRNQQLPAMGLSSDAPGPFEPPAAGVQLPAGVQPALSNWQVGTVAAPVLSAMPTIEAGSALAMEGAVAMPSATAGVLQ